MNEEAPHARFEELCDIDYDWTFGLMGSAEDFEITI